MAGAEAIPQRVGEDSKDTCDDFAARVLGGALQSSALPTPESVVQAADA